MLPRDERYDCVTAGGASYATAKNYATLRRKACVRPREKTHFARASIDARRRNNARIALTCRSLARGRAQGRWGEGGFGEEDASNEQRVLFARPIGGHTGVE